MKKIIILLSLLTAILISSTTTAQDKMNLLKTSLSAPLIRTYTLAFERVLNPDMSLQLGGNYFAGWKFGDNRFNGYAITPEFRYYLSESKEAPDGGFIAPYARYGVTGIKMGEPGDEDYGKAEVRMIGGGLLIGTQRIFKNLISLEAFIGPAYYNAKLDVESGIEEDFALTLLDGWSVRLGVTIGILF